MRKNKILRASFCLLIAVMITSSVVGGTFAKYVSADDSIDLAYVAYWGVKASIEGTLFGEHYYGASNDVTSNSIAFTTTGSVDTSRTNGEDIIAPGTKSGTGLTISLSGKPEVNTCVSLATDGFLQENEDIWLLDGNYYVMAVAENVDSSNYTQFVFFDGTKYRIAKDTDEYSDSTTYYSPFNAGGLNKSISFNTTGTRQMLNYLYIDYSVYSTDDPLYAASKAEAELTMNRFHDGAYYPIVYSLESSVSTADVDPVSTTYYSITSLNGDLSKSSGVDCTDNLFVNGSAKNSFSSSSFKALDLSETFGTKTITWYWPYSTQYVASEIVDGPDSILGFISNMSDSCGYIVLYRADSTGTYQQVTKAANSSAAYCGDTQVASLGVLFSLELAVAQVD